MLAVSTEKVNVVEQTGLELHFYDPSTKTIYWNPKLGIVTNENVALSPASALNHEADHALQNVTKTKQSEKDRGSYDKNYSNKEEKRVIQGSEQKVARQLGEIKQGQVTRKDHKAKVAFITNNPMSNKGTIVDLKDLPKPKRKKIPEENK